ncbi:MAG: hypothetical protein IT184_17095 [Acidobacteria bacterium]|nr:hypothetical protein [Acidobacteriota bacterium]
MSTSFRCRLVLVVSIGLLSTASDALAQNDDLRGGSPQRAIAFLRANLAEVEGAMYAYSTWEPLDPLGRFQQRSVLVLQPARRKGFLIQLFRICEQCPAFLTGLLEEVAVENTTVRLVRSVDPAIEARTACLGRGPFESTQTFDVVVRGDEARAVNCAAPREVPPEGPNVVVGIRVLHNGEEKAPPEEIVITSGERSLRLPVRNGIWEVPREVAAVERFTLEADVDDSHVRMPNLFG